jgi:hypothetical protein
VWGCQAGEGKGLEQVRRLELPFRPRGEIKEEQPMYRRRAENAGRARGDKKRFPYEPRVIGGKLVMPAELQRIHQAVLDAPMLESVTDEMRTVVETLWPELVNKLPPTFVAG